MDKNKSQPKPRRRSRLSSFLRFAFLVLTAAALVAAYAIHATFRKFDAASAEFDLSALEKMEVASVVLDREGRQIGQFYISNRQPVKLSEVSPSMVNAVIAVEDGRFWTHKGVDPVGMFRAFWKNTASGKIQQGASTITQQLARNSFSLKGKNYNRKLLEIALSRRIETQLDKKTILELYLNRVYFGSGFYGVEAAARGYFGVAAKDLSVSQSATLAGLIKSPNSLSPLNNPDASLKARNYALERMAAEKLITASLAASLSSEPINVRPRGEEGKVSYPLEMVRQEAISKLGYERTMNGGYRIFTTESPKLQSAAERAVEDHLRSVESNPSYKGQTFSDFERLLDSSPLGQGRKPLPSYLQAALVVVENKTGAILALVGGRSFSHSEYNRATRPSRPASGVFSPFLLAAAFEKGVPASSVFQDWPLDNRFVGMGGQEGILGEWGVETSDNQYEGPLTIREIFSKGKNAALARLGFEVGVEKMASFASKIGLRPPADPKSNLALGSIGCSPSELARAYTMFPRGGTLPDELYMIEKIEDPSGTVVFSHTGTSQNVIPETQSYRVHSMMEEGMRKGPASRVKPMLSPGNDTAVGRSGTSYGFEDAWFAGYNSAVTCVVWVGFDKPAGIYDGAFGSFLAAPIWAAAMNAAPSPQPSPPFSPPFGLKKITICPSTGGTASEGCAESSLSDPGKSPREEYDLVDSPEPPSCPEHSGKVKSYVKEFREGPWPRAALTIDLATIRPENVSSQYVVGNADPYNSVSALDASAKVVAPALKPDETVAQPSAKN